LKTFTRYIALFLLNIRRPVPAPVIDRQEIEGHPLLRKHGSESLLERRLGIPDRQHRQGLRANNTIRHYWFT
jgi:hypothetical protein